MPSSYISSQNVLLKNVKVDSGGGYFVLQNTQMQIIILKIQPIAGYVKRRHVCLRQDILSLPALV